MNLLFAFLFSLLLVFNAEARHSISVSRYELLSGAKQSREFKKYWNRKYSNGRYIYGKAPARFLSRNYDYIPSGGKVLDMGMGEGRNAVFLARKGYKVTGIDISSVAVKKARMLAREFGVRIEAVVASLNSYKIPKETFDAIVCFYYVDRSLINKISSWLKPGGILIYEAYTDKQKTIRGSKKFKNEFLLKPGELLGMFETMHLLKFEEPLHKKSYTSSVILRRKKNGE